MTDTISESGNELQNVIDCGPWYQETHGKYIAVRLSSRDTNGRYAIVESVADPGTATPMHLHRNEEEHSVVIAGGYRIAIEDRVSEASAGTSVTAPKGAPHSWRNISGVPAW
jgi:quercetin dioxygenase-like cupin family protein